MDLVADSTARIWVLEHDHLVLKAEAGTRGPHGGGRKTVLTLGEGLTGFVARTREVLLLNDVLADPRTVNVEWTRREGIGTFVGLPLVAGERLVGVLSVLVRRCHAFTADEVELLTSSSPASRSCSARRKAMGCPRRSATTSASCSGTPSA